MNVIPEDMDVPEMRRDVTKPENVRWLIRNLAFRNGDHLEFKAVMDTLKALKYLHEV